MWPKAKRAVSDETAAAIAAAAKQGGAEAVGVFVDEDAATITQRCRQAGISIAQLHGDASRACLNSIPGDLQVKGKDGLIGGGTAGKEVGRVSRPASNSSCQAVEVHAVTAAAPGLKHTTESMCVWYGGCRWCLC